MKSSQKTAADKLEQAINKILADYANDATKDIEAIAVQLGKKGASALRDKANETFPVNRQRRSSGNYAAGWTSTVERTRTGATVTIYNSKKPGLAHLLEFGHVTRNGTGRTFQRTPAYKHIEPIADELETTYEREVLGKL